VSHTIVPVVNGFEMRLPEIAFLPEVSALYPEISFDSWRVYMTETWQTDPKWTLRSWQAAHRLTLMDEVVPEEGHFLVGDLNIDSAREGMRMVESGEHLLPSGVGRVCWNGVVFLNNKAASRVEDLILPWDEDVHPAFATITPSRQENSIQHLRKTYQMLRDES
jgi:hypothetical protein